MATVTKDRAQERERTVGLSRTALGRAVPSAWRRADRRLRDDPVLGWVGTLAVTLLAFVLRVWHLKTPKAFEFDETYYAKDAWSMLHFGYARNYDADADRHILAGVVDGQWLKSPEMIVHPDVGKWLIAAGEKLFGMDPFGWRIAACVVGSLMVLVMIRFARRITRSTLLGLVAGVLLCFDGLEFVLSRLALLDIFVAFFTLLAAHFMVADRDWCRRRTARAVSSVDGPPRWGPVRRLLFRPWLLAAGVTWGLAIGTKWQAAYVLAAFGLLYAAWCIGMRRSFGVRRAWAKALLVDGPVAFLHLVVVAVVVYVATWTPWMVHADVYEKSLSSTQYTQYTGHGHCDGTSYVADHLDTKKRWPTATEPDAHGLGEVWQSLRTLWYYHRDVYTFHTHFLNCATHTYESQPSGWLLLNRPVGVAADTGIKPGTDSCDAPTGSTCLRQVILLGTPLLWWGSCLAAIAALFYWILARDWRFGVAVVGIASSWLPWLMYADRPIFSYYTIVTLPFLVLACTLVIGKLIGSGRDSSRRRTVGVVVSGAFVVLVIANFAWFWPIYTDQLLTHSEWLDRIWFKRWI
ncbi:dolichyl-phosphate-mannose--protein mannosyltransferase [Nocardioides cheoyonin]|uniref:dolichyl-phosphate-mannose--protein mannosyltransferase n=1 Tax=Nocardioides cheoyonin TaxID=3156615 RepID=UPI0032B5F3D3